MWKEASKYALKLKLQQTQGPKTLIAFDLGTKSTGVAISNPKLNKGYLLTVIRKSITSQEFVEDIKKIMAQRKPNAIIIGKPSYVKESFDTQNMADKIDKFINSVKSTNFPIGDLTYTFVDESWSTQQSKDQLKLIEAEYRQYGHLHKQKQLLDGMAAINILRRYLDYYNGT